MNIQKGDKYTEKEQGYTIKILEIDRDMVQVHNPYGKPWMPMSLLVRKIS
jgi:hypothetical protein